MAKSDNPYTYFPGSNYKLHLAAAEEIVQNPDKVYQALQILDAWAAKENKNNKLFLE